MQATRLRSSTARPAPQRTRSVKCYCQDGKKKVIVLGGTGRVGSATAASLLENFKHYEITVASRSQSSFEKIVKLRPGLENAKFAPCDIGSKESVKVHPLRGDSSISTAHYTDCIQFFSQISITLYL